MIVEQISCCPIEDIFDEVFWSGEISLCELFSTQKVNTTELLKILNDYQKKIEIMKNEIKHYEYEHVPCKEQTNEKQSSGCEQPPF